jgi:hypothetical protein
LLTHEPDVEGKAGLASASRKIAQRSQTAVWQCPECEYWNDEPAQRCERCQTERDEEPPPPVATPAEHKPAAVQPDAGGRRRERKRWTPLERAALTVIVAVALVLGALAVFAWRGGFSLAGLTGGRAAGPGPATTAASAPPVVAEEEEAEHPLDPIYADDQPGLRQLRPFAER